MKNLRITSMILMVFCACVAGCKGQPSSSETQSEKLSPEQAIAARQAIVAWLECEECTSGELEAVVKLGSTAVPSLAATLRSGPPPSSREIQREHLVQTYRGMEAYAKTHPRESGIKMSEEEYVRLYSENYVALYQIRAARALGSIGGEQSRNSLTDALNTSLREDVRTSVKETLQKMNSPR